MNVDEFLEEGFFNELEDDENEQEENVVRTPYTDVDPDLIKFLF